MVGEETAVELGLFPGILQVMIRVDLLIAPDRELRFEITAISPRSALDRWVAGE